MDGGEKEIIRILTELIWLGTDWGERWEGMKTSSFEKNNQYLDALDMSDLRVVCFDVGVFAVVGEYRGCWTLVLQRCECEHLGFGEC